MVRRGLGKQYTQEELELMKTQDIKYLMIKAQNEKKVLFLIPAPSLLS